MSHLDDLVTHLRWLELFGDKSALLDGLSAAKVRHFAGEAQVLDAAELKDITPPKRYTLLRAWCSVLRFSLAMTWSRCSRNVSRAFTRRRIKSSS